MRSARRRGPRLLGDDVQVQDLGPAQDAHGQASAHPVLGQQPLQVVDAADRVAVDADEDVPRLQPGPLGSTPTTRTPTSAPA
ncbi:MAG TPA: hypothetical protein VF590_14765 [Isosphaeraceae bacterium]